MLTLISASGTRIDTPRDMLGVLTEVSGDEAIWTAPVLGADIGIADVFNEQGFCRVVRSIWTRLAAITGSVGPGEDLATTSRWRSEFVPGQSIALGHLMNQTLTNVQRCLRILEQGMYELDSQRVRMPLSRAQDILDNARSALSESRYTFAAFVEAYAEHADTENTRRVLEGQVAERDATIKTLQGLLDRQRKPEAPSFRGFP